MATNGTSYTVGSLFAGVGGICQAFKDASCNIVWANEVDENSRRTYLANHPEVTFTSNHDVQDITKKNTDPVDILTAGFPCQPFSQAGRAKGFDDPRGHLFYDVVRLMRELSPRAYLLENVKTLATHHNGESFSVIATEIEKAGYSFIPFILRACEYTDIPQGRERIFIVGFRGEKTFHYGAPIKINDLKDFLGAPQSSNFTIPPPLGKDPRPVTDFLEAKTAEPSDFYGDPNSKIHQRVREAVTKPGIVYQYRRWFVRENKSNVCPTLTANMGLGGHNIPIVLDQPFPRRLSPKECFNLQGFKDFKIPSDVSKVQLYRQCGNSVVVPLVERIAREIVRVLDENRSR
jgi:DNA (cytosine-5)-methyltransferase 1